jgi:hypothetical protein
MYRGVSVSPRAVLMALSWIMTLLLAAWAYWPGLQGPLILDDFENLKVLQKLDDGGRYFLDSVQANMSSPLGRPLAMISFLFEKSYFDAGIYGQKTTNLYLHLFNACLVLIFARYLFRATGQSPAGLLAQLAASLWLLAPLLLSTTLYVVQRMAIQSALFSLLALICYCAGRERQLQGERAWHWIFAAISCTAAAFLSKENGILIVPVFTALELYLYHFQAVSTRVSTALRYSHGLVCAAGVLAVVGVLVFAPDLVFAGYADREFTAWQRLLTQARVLWIYLQQFFWPDPHLLGVYHDDFRFSTGLLAPHSTFWALLAWLCVAGGLVFCAVRRQFALVAFGIAFYLIGHALESSILSLELYFEHRNYLPAVGLVIALVSLAAWLQKQLPLLRPWLMLGFGILLLRQLFLLGSQAEIWSDSYLIHMEAVNYHPRSARARLGLAQLYARDDNLAGALELVDDATRLGGTGEMRAALIQAVYYCQANSVLPAGHWQGLKFIQQEVSGLQFSSQFRQVVRLFIDEKCGANDPLLTANAFRQLMYASGKPMATPMMLGAMVLLENHLQRYQLAMEYAELLSQKLPGSVMALQFRLYFATRLELADARATAVKELMQLRDSGQLNREETDNLELFINE